MKRTPILRKSAPKKTNPARRKREFERCYGSKERVAFVRTLACAACGMVGYSENAHLLGNGGMSRKGNADTVGPLCGPQFSDHPTAATSSFMGCHFLYDSERWRFDVLFPGFDPLRVADETESLWRASLGSSPGGEK